MDEIQNSCIEGLLSYITGTVNTCPAWYFVRFKQMFYSGQQNIS